MVRQSRILVRQSEAARGEMGQMYLAAGDKVALRLWDEQPSDVEKPVTSREYETVGYVLDGRAILTLGSNQSVELKPGDSWLVPAGAEHTYQILEHFRAVEATSPPARRNRLDTDEHDRGVDYRPEDVLA